MLQLRARGFAIRDVFPDALRGVIMAEEAQDTPAEPREVPNLAQREPAPVPQTIAAPEPRLPVLAPDGTLAHVKPGRWLASVGKALAMLETSEAVREWRNAMGQHIGTVSEDDSLMAGEADRLIEDRLAELSDAEGA
jgi:hypothetical protein